MAEVKKEELLRIPQVIEEIKRHLWIESEQAGYDIGFDNAADDWIKKYSIDWLKYYMPEKLEQPKSKSEEPEKKDQKEESAKKETAKKETAVPKKAVKRSAKSYRK
jgi:hypothetical protein